MTDRYQIVVLGAAERERLEHVYADLRTLADVAVPSVRSAARAALAQIAQALNGQGIAYDLYSADLSHHDLPLESDR